MTLLDIRGLSKAYTQAGTRIEVLSNLELQLNAGETVAIVGQSGSGKSTFLSLVAGLDKPDAGSILLDGRDLAQMNEIELAAFRAASLGIVFQQFHLMSHLTALENVSLPLEIMKQKEARARAEAALESVGLSARKTHFPHQLSGGERQRVAIARACVVEPRLLLADEPSGNLDAHTGEQVMAILFDLVSRRGMTMMLVTHNESLAKRCNRQLLLQDGKLH